MAPTPATAPSSAHALLGALANRPGATAAELAKAAGIGRSTAGKLLASLQAEGRVVRQPGGHQAGRRTADRWTLPTPPANPTQDPNPVAATPPAAPTAEKANKDRPPSSESGRLGAGQLRQLVLACLADRPGQSLSPTAIAKTLGGRSAGAVANALRTLAGQGAVVQIQAKPRRYCITPAGGHQDGAAR
jgi:DNA-binding transcriptional MocR family regulator